MPRFPRRTVFAFLGLRWYAARKECGDRLEGGGRAKSSAGVSSKVMFGVLEKVDSLAGVALVHVSMVPQT